MGNEEPPSTTGPAVRPVRRTTQRFSAIPEALFERKKSSGRLGPLLAWGVVFADIGTSIYYVPGLLFRELGSQSPSPAAAFVLRFQEIPAAEASSIRNSSSFDSGVPCFNIVFNTRLCS